ncbi:MAG: hypothetical protein JSU63_14135 [Phycisphaerales bacterium]|nr:MAG: hypothetical protein JSU63_14135 [Phycisphaerales bacterium]
MQPIHSGTTTERLVRSGILVLLVLGFAIAFLWDGYIGYARKNAIALIESVGVSRERTPAVNPNLTAENAQQIITELQAGMPVDDVKARLGKWPLEHDGVLYYMGPGGYLQLNIERELLTAVEWKDGPHKTESDQGWQRWIGYAMVAIGMICIARFMQIARTRVSLTQAGLQIRGHPLIPFEAMTVLRAGDRDARETITLEYSIGGRTGTVLLESCVIKRFPEIVNGIREQAGFPSPSDAEG